MKRTPEVAVEAG